ncbi:6-hydroxymethylpterin diphosphokinase MptE-like protein [Helicobacter sp. 16-1353]|uniref:motility associated factor glycosyltransferase family protein n=1 Tax=Helicobacter sp. 16-1353 TaxID=2004996 RepID=UPI0011BE4A0E|nr:6-hydroxymethylpterin diphosphokinase MptE-like protein [Helicobacter sp. 16-1353]
MPSILESLQNRDEKALLQRMLDNLAFFEVHNKHIAKALKDTLEGKNKQYQLLFNKDEINIIDLVNNKYLYPKDSFINIAYSIALNPLNNKIWKVYANNLSLAKIDTKNLYITSNAINEMVDFTYDNILDSKLSNLYHLPSLFLPQTNIFGLCGGVFLQILLENDFTFHSLLIFEEDLALFSLSCYFVDFKRLFSQVSNKSCYIFIENIVSKAFLNHYFYSKKVTNNFLRLELNAFISPKISAIKDMVNEAYKVNSRGWGSFEDEMIGVKNTLQNIHSNKILHKTTKLNIPICVIGSGPSLESNIDFLRNNQNKMLIFSCGTALKILKQHNINIDFQIEIERIDYLSSVLEDSSIGDTSLLCANVVNNKVLNLSPNRYIFIRGGTTSSYMFKDANIIEFCAPFVGNAGFSLACNFSDTIILCGIDCGYIKDKPKHSKGSFYGDENSEIPPYSFKVKGNSNVDVYSSSIFSLSRESIEIAIKHYKPKIIYNIGDGAYIQGTKVSKNIIFEKDINKDSIKNEFLKCFSNDVVFKDNLNSDIMVFVDELKRNICVDIATKQELFTFIDNITAFLAKSSSTRPHCGILFEGTILHLLQNMMICILYAKTNDIADIARFYVDIIAKCLDKLLSEYQSNLLS